MAGEDDENDGGKPNLSKDEMQAARAAWREFARARSDRRGARISASQAPRVGILVAVLVACVGVSAFWWSAHQDERTAVMTYAAPDSRASKPSAVPWDAATIENDEERSSSVVAPASRPGSAMSGRPPPPAGTPPMNARAYQRLPMGRDDRAPVGGVGRDGAHVDRIVVGAKLRGGECEQNGIDVSLATSRMLHLCFRVVHARLDEQVVVLWRRDGRTRKRTFVRVPASHHGYRTRQVLHNPEHGRWDITVMSEDRVLLASTSFVVGP